MSKPSSGLSMGPTHPLIKAIEYQAKVKGLPEVIGCEVIPKFSGKRQREHRSHFRKLNKRFKVKPQFDLPVFAPIIEEPDLSFRALFASKRDDIEPILFEYNFDNETVYEGVPRTRSATELKIDSDEDINLNQNDWLEE